MSDGVAARGETHGNDLPGANGGPEFRGADYDPAKLPSPRFCDQCGTRLVLREQPEDGPRPWCPECQAWHYPVFNVACSMIVYHPDGRRILNIDQYGKQGILVAGYVSRGDNLEETVRREVREETGLELSRISYNASRFFGPSNTLMVNFACTARDVSVRLNPGEVDEFRWEPVEDVLDDMYPHSLARWFVAHHLEMHKQGAGQAAGGSNGAIRD